MGRVGWSKERLDRLLLALVGREELVDMWWTNQNRAFDFKTPNEVYLESPDKVINYILDQFHH